MNKESIQLVNIIDVLSGKNLQNAVMTIQNNLDKNALKVYQQAINKVVNDKKLNLNELILLDKIDELTFLNNGFCLKDAFVTKARIEASNCYDIKFIDRDNLILHMNQFINQ